MSERPLGWLTAAEALHERRVGDIAQTARLTRAEVKERLEEARGNTQVRNVFREVWPFEYQELGGVTVASALDYDLAGWVCRLTELSHRSVIGRLNRAHGKMLLRNVFEEVWPTDAHFADETGRCTAAEALRTPILLARVVAICGFSGAVVERQLAAAHGNSLIRNVLSEAWPTSEDDDEDNDEDNDEDATSHDAHEDATDDDLNHEDGTDDEDREDPTTLLGSPEVDLLGATRVVSARSTAAVTWLAEQIGWTPRKMRNFLRNTHGRTLLRNALEDHWPLSVGASARAMLGDIRVAAVRRSTSLIVWAARLGGMDAAQLEIELADVEGNMLLRNHFGQWPPKARPAQPVAKSKPRASASTAEHGAGGSPRATPSHANGIIGPGTLITGRWRIQCPIGDRGGFGQVYVVRDETKPDRDGLVMKVAGGTTDVERRNNEERLRSEFKIAHGLTHQNICAYLDDGLDQELGVYFAIMKHAGDSLERLIRDGGTFDFEDALDVVSQTAAGLDYAHGRGIIHHDLKPANILVHQEPGRREIRVGDWGISRYGRDTRRADGSPTVVASVLGYSHGYTAPEQWRGEARAASDQYCLALVFCSMLEGRVFTEHYRFTTLRALSGEQNDVLRRALSQEPEDRFAGCPQFVSKLKEA